jgi:hypothetical protein
MEFGTANGGTRRREQFHFVMKRSKNEPKVGFLSPKTDRASANGTAARKEFTKNCCRANACALALGEPLWTANRTGFRRLA